MKRIERTRINTEVLRQTRWIYRQLVIGCAIIVFAIIYGLLTPYDLYTVAAAGGGIMGGVIVALAFVMLGRMPPAEQKTKFIHDYEFEQVTRPVMPIAHNRALLVNWQRIMTADQWACVRFHVRRNQYYISRESLRQCGLSNEQYRDLRAELIRCHVMPTVGNLILDSDAARAVFDPPTPTVSPEVDGPSRTDDGRSYAI